MTRMNGHDHKCGACKKYGTEECPKYIAKLIFNSDDLACAELDGYERIRPKKLYNFVKFTNTKDTLFYIRKDLITELTDEKIKEDKYVYQIWWQEGNTRRFEDISLEEYERLVEEVVD